MCTNFQYISVTVVTVKMARSVVRWFNHFNCNVRYNHALRIGKNNPLTCIWRFIEFCLRSPKNFEIQMINTGVYHLSKTWSNVGQLWHENSLWCPAYWNQVIIFESDVDVNNALYYHNSAFERISLASCRRGWTSMATVRHAGWGSHDVGPYQCIITMTS